MGQLRFSVKRLEEISFEAAYQEILANLSLIPIHRPEERRNLVSYSSLISLNPFFTSENVRTYIKNRLAQTLIGTFNDETRQKFVEHFNQYDYDFDSKSLPSIFFDVVLDENFTDLSVNVAGPGGIADLEAIPTIARCSPHLSSLILNFEVLDRKLSAGKIKPILQSLNRLTNLTSLTLKNLEIAQKDSLVFLGNAVPRLKHLTFMELTIEKEDLLNLLLGENISKLAERNIDEDILHQYKLPSSWISPFCHTLESLELEMADEKKKLISYCEFSSISPSVVACCIRHMPALQEIGSSSSSVPTAVRMLHQNSLPEDWITSESMKIDEENEESENMMQPFICPTGVLSLKSLDYVNIRNDDMVRAVGAICPYLDRVVMVDADLGKVISSSDLRSYLPTHWPKIRHLTLNQVSPEYRKTVIEIFGKELLSLTLAGCENVDPLEFVNCPRLETLKLLLSTTLLPDLDLELHPLPFSAETFLPNLKTLESDICLGVFSPFFQEKRSLINISIECCHVATNATEWQPMRIAKMWPRVQNFRMRRASGLNMGTADDVFSMFGNLKTLGLPHWMLYQKEERMESYFLKEKFESRKITLTFERPTTDTQCYLFTNEYQWENSDSEGESSVSGGAKFIDFEADVGVDWLRDDYDSYEDYDDFNTTSDESFDW